MSTHWNETAKINDCILVICQRCLEEKVLETLTSTSKRTDGAEFQTIVITAFVETATSKENDFQPFTVSLSIWVENGMAQPRESFCHNKALVLLLMFWRGKVTAMRYASALCGHHLPPVSYQRGEGSTGAEERWGVVIAMDPFLYESRHWLPHGKDSFLEGGNGYFSSCCSQRWAECKLHPAQPVETRAGERSPPTIPFPSHHPVRSWDISYCLGTGTDQSENSLPTCDDAIFR